MAEPEQCVCGGEAGVVNSGVAGGSVADRVSVSVIVPMYNAAGWLPACLESVLCQDYDGTLELSVYDDSSTDASMDVVSAWRARLEYRGMLVTVTQGPPQAPPRGVGYAKNGAVAASRGDMLCFLDADDIMAPCRVSLQYVTAAQHRDAIVGCRFSRDPPESTQRYTKWANSLTAAQLYTQVYTAHGPTVVMPTWFCAREVFTKVGGFSEAGRGTPEDLIFFYEHLRLGGAVLRVDHDLLVYRYHEQATTFSISEHTIWSLRMAAFQDRVLKHWDTFTIWNAGKQGRHFYRSLSSHNQLKVTNFCDVDVKKISKGFYTYEESTTKPKPKVPIIHFSEATPPIVICVKQDLTAGGFESNLASLNLKEGVDYYFFS